MGRPEISRRSGISNATLKGIERPDFTPTLKTLRGLEKAIPPDWMPVGGFPFGANIDALSVKDFALGTRKLSGDKSDSLKVLLDDQAVISIEPTQIARIKKFLDERRSDASVLREADCDLDVVKAIGPQCACHVYDLGGDDPGDYRAVHWDVSTKYKQSEDYTGRKISTIDDPTLLSCQIEDFKMVRATGWPHFAAIRRNFRGGESRSFLRLMIPFQGSDNRTKVISVTKPQEFTT